jgi:hypothetical protein
MHTTTPSLVGIVALRAIGYHSADFNGIASTSSQRFRLIRHPDARTSEMTAHERLTTVGATPAGLCRALVAFRIGRGWFYMTVEFDHLFVCTSVGAPEANKLLELGFSEGQNNIHPGQGTACRRFFFHNAYLEFFWVHDEKEASSTLVQPLCLWERWQYQQTGYSPFGFGLRPSQQGTGQVALPFKTWVYRPSYLPPPMGIEIAENSFPSEPLIFYSSLGERPEEYPAERKQPLEHAVRVKEISEIRITLPEMRPSSALKALEQSGIVKLILGAEPLAEVAFDGAKQGEERNCRPVLPLVLKW